MTIALTTFEAQLNSLVPDNDAELAVADRYRAVRQAIALYSLDFPDEITADVTGDAGKFYAVATALTSWSEGHSRILKIEYPAATVASDEQPQYLEPEDWDDNYWYDSVRYLWLPNHAPAATEKMRITYTAPYAWVAGSTSTSVSKTAHGFAVNDVIYQNYGEWTAASDPYLGTHIVTTVTNANAFMCKNLAIDAPTAHFFAVCDLAACVACRAIAAKYAFIGDSTVNVDSAAHINKSQAFAERANDFCARYQAALGRADPDAEKAATPAGEFVDFDTVPGWPSNRQFIFRGKAVR